MIAVVEEFVGIGLVSLGVAGQIFVKIMNFDVDVQISLKRG